MGSALGRVRIVSVTVALADAPIVLILCRHKRMKSIATPNLVWVWDLRVVNNLLYLYSEQK